MGTKFDNYGGKTDFLEHKEEKFADFNTVSGGGKSVDPYGDKEAKKAEAIDMNAGNAFAKKNFTKIEAMGTEAPKKDGKPGQFADNKGDHFKTETDNANIDAFGTECGKSKSYQSRH